MLEKTHPMRPGLITGTAREGHNPKLRKACEDFEAVFTYQLLRGMRRTVEKSGLFHGGVGEEVYESMLDQELSKSMATANRGGLADLLYDQLLPRAGAGGSRSGGLPRDTPGPPSTNHLSPPVEGRVSSEFGWRVHPILGQKRFHRGIDIAAEEGSVIRAAMPGTVAASEYREGYGNLVVIEHTGGYSTLYAHNRENLVREGDRLDAGDPVGLVGSTGRSTGPHLHFEITRHGRNLDPAGFLGPKLTRGSTLTEAGT
jgi:murein DD-endopeptidase MepM/ murein hydrolase activator NlpD